MKNCGITRNVDDLGRIVIPKELRKTLGIESGTPLDIYTEEDYIILRKYKQSKECCVFCGTTEDIFKFKNNFICNDCKNDITK